MKVEIAEVKELSAPGGDAAEVVYRLTYEVEGEAKPCCVADLVFRYYLTSPAITHARHDEPRREAAHDEHAGHGPTGRMTTEPGHRPGRRGQRHPDELPGVRLG